MKHDINCDFDATPEIKERYIKIFKVMGNLVDKCMYCGNMIEKLNMTEKYKKGEVKKC